MFSRKANNLFEKNAAPILHLAGVEITVVKVWFVFVFCESRIHLLKALVDFPLVDNIIVRYIFFHRRTMKARQKS